MSTSKKYEPENSGKFPEDMSEHKKVEKTYTTKKDDCCEDVKSILTTGVAVRLQPPDSGEGVEQLALWQEIDESKANFIDFNNFMDKLFSTGSTTKPVAKLKKSKDKSDFTPPLEDVVIDEKALFASRSLLASSQAYDLIKYAAEQFVRTQLDFTESEIQLPIKNVLPYSELVIQQLEALKNYRKTDANNPPFLRLRGLGYRAELIWSYWHEEGMQVQTMNAIARRFQNLRSGPSDPLANLEIDPLRPLTNILWRYVQDTLSQNRLSIARRTYEYDHHYGIRLFGKAIPEFNPADSRSKFIEAFHNLLYKCTIYFKEVDDMTRRADAFPLLNALREVHLLLTEGMHNQFGDLPLTSRVEMMIEQWIMGRQEIMEFLRGRAMVVYDEPWMGVVDTMKTLQGWPSTSISYYHDLAEFGEDLLLTIRWTPWTQINNRQLAANWANRYRDAIQRYIYSYNVVTGVDLSVDAVDVSKNEKIAMPGILIQQKFQKERMLKRG